MSSLAFQAPRIRFPSLPSLPLSQLRGQGRGLPAVHDCEGGAGVQRCAADRQTSDGRAAQGGGG